MNYFLLGKILKDARENIELKQSDVAKICNVTPQTISVWEKGTTKIDIENLSKLCYKYNISCAETINKCLGDKETFKFLVNESEYNLVKKYRFLNESDKSTVDFIFNKPEYQSIINNTPPQTPELTADLDMDEFFRIEDEQYDTIAADEGGIKRRKIK